MLSDNDNYDHECWGNATLTKRDPVLLYDLNSDPGERHPLNHNDYKEKLLEIKSIYKKLQRNIKWGDSEMNKGGSKTAAPCCSTKSGNCEPYPKCCDCDKRRADSLFSYKIDI